jgi:hypothetical protein
VVPLVGAARHVRQRRGLARLLVGGLLVLEDLDERLSWEDADRELALVPHAAAKQVHAVAALLEDGPDDEARGADVGDLARRSHGGAESNLLALKEQITQVDFETGGFGAFRGDSARTPRTHA